jgi:hypothetical protein
MQIHIVQEICNTFSILKGCKSKLRISGPVCIYIFYLFMVTQHILKFMKGNIESSCISATYLQALWLVTSTLEGQ